MKSLLISSVFPPHLGGSGRWFWELYRRLPRDEVVVAAGEHPGQREFDETHNLPVVRLPLAGSNRGLHHWAALRDYYHNYRQLARLVSRHRIDQIHCGTILPEGWLGWLLHHRFGLPYLCYVHGEETNYIRQSREFTWMARRVLGAAAMVIVNSRNTCRVLRDDWNVSDKRLQVLHPGVDIDRFVPAARDAVVRGALGWRQRPVVLTVGRLQARKGQDRMILALRELRKSLPDILYVVVGEGEQRESLEKLVAAEGLQSHVQFRGAVGDKQLITCYQQCDLSVLPNRMVDGDFEGFGMVLLEAQACGRPVLAGTSGGTAETMRVSETGRLVCCDYPEPLADALIEMLSDRENLERMGQAARRWVVEQFDWNELTKRATDLFESVATQGKQTGRRTPAPVAAAAEAVVGQRMACSEVTVGDQTVKA